MEGGRGEEGRGGRGRGEIHLKSSSDVVLPNFLIDGPDEVSGGELGHAVRVGETLNTS